MKFFREIARIETRDVVLRYAIQSNPFELELQTPGAPRRFQIEFQLPAGIFSTEFDSLLELPGLTASIDVTLVDIAASHPARFSRMALSLDSELQAVLDGPDEWAKVFELYKEMGDEVEESDWNDYHAAQTALKTNFWPPAVQNGSLRWVARQLNGELVGVELSLSDLRLTKRALQ